MGALVHVLACCSHTHTHAQVADAQPDSPAADNKQPTIERLVESAGVSMGPIALTFGSDERGADDASTSGRW